MARKKTSKPDTLIEKARATWGSEQSELSLPENPVNSQGVTLVTDPFGIRTAEVTLAQIDEDTPIEEALETQPAEDYSEAIQESDAQLDKLQTSMKQEHERNVEELTEAVEASEHERAQELAEQIAEDEALSQMEAKEAEENEALSQELQAALPHRNENGELDTEELQSCVETLLFMSDKPVSLAKLKEWLFIEMESQALRDAIAVIQERYRSPNHGFELIEVAGGYQFRTKPIRAALACRLAKVQNQRLSRGAMETLSIVAYKQPALKEDIDKIRGVDSSHFIRTLLDKRLIHMAGRSELPGRPILYATTQYFLEVFSLTDLSALPPLRELEQMVPTSESDDPDNEDPKVREMRRLVAEMKADKHRIAYDPKEDEKLLGDIRERVKSIPTTTPYLEALAAQEAAQEEQETVPEGPAQQELTPPESAPAEDLPTEKLDEPTPFDAG